MHLASGTRKLLGFQLLLVGAASMVFLVRAGSFQAASVWFGGAVAVINALLLVWRQQRAGSGRALSAGESLRVLYRSALERLIAVVVMFALGMAVLHLDALALLTGFIAGQLALFANTTNRTD
ncbi:MAG: ATP synthase subunit I [Gammaproteobacteria bacterium]